MLQVPGPHVLQPRQWRDTVGEAREDEDHGHGADRAGRAREQRRVEEHVEARAEAGYELAQAYVRLCFVTPWKTLIPVRSRHT